MIWKFERNAKVSCLVYIMGNDGRFIRSVEMVCPDEDTAKDYAKQFVDGHDIELWQGRPPHSKVQQ
jgi:hypothetical protein